MRLNIKVDAAVQDYADSILKAAKDYKCDVDIDVVTNETSNTTGTEKANQILITSELGVVVVFPDFTKSSARATIFDMGELNRLQKEGFSDDFIEEKGHVYGALLKKTQKNAEMFGYYLTHKLNLKSKTN